jgi:lysophospholipase L1-like esterase
VRTLHDEPHAKWTLLLIGAGLLRKLATVPEFAGRRCATAPFTKLRGDQLVAVVRQFHPSIYADAPAQLLHNIDAGFSDALCDGPGAIRSWAMFTNDLLEVFDSHGKRTLDEHVAALALASFLGPDDADDDDD